MRKDTTRLPEALELSSILAKEASRPVPEAKAKIHYPRFGLAIEWFKHFHLPTAIFTKETNAEAIISEARKLIPRLTLRMLSDKTPPTNLYLRIYEYLSKEDKLQKADFIFVPGAKTFERAKKAVELYKKGLAPLVVFSGRSPVYYKTTLSEAERFRARAIKLGVPKEAIMVETSSITIPDNVKSVLNLLDEKKIAYQSIILVNSPYVQRRTWAHLKKYTTDKIKIIRVNCQTIPGLLRDDWFGQEKGIWVIANEFVKMRIAVVLNTA